MCRGTRAVVLADRSRFDTPVGYVACTGCGLVHREPPLTAEAAAELYRSGDYADENALDRSQARNYQKLLDDREPIDPARLEFLGRYLDLPSRGAALEIGCGAGSFIGRLHQQGWKAYGIEPDPGMCAFVRRHWGLEVAQGTMETVTLPKAGYDLVVMLHVFEHLTDPLAALERIGTTLKSDGLLFIEVPNILDLWTVHRRWYDGFDFTHVYNFSRTTLTNMLQLGGFEVVGMRETHVLKCVARHRPGLTPSITPEDYRRVARRVRLYRIKHKLRRTTKGMTSFLARTVMGAKGFENAKRYYRAFRQRLGGYR